MYELPTYELKCLFFMSFAGLQSNYSNLHVLFCLRNHILNLSDIESSLLR